MKPTNALLAIHLAQTVSLRPRNSDLLLARIFGKYEKAEANARLMAAAWNACVEINPENPIAAAEAMPEMFRLLLAVVADAQKICGKRLDLEEWLMKANETVDKAMKGAR